MPGSTAVSSSKASAGQLTSLSCGSPLPPARRFGSGNSLLIEEAGCP